MSSARPERCGPSGASSADTSAPSLQAPVPDPRRVHGEHPSAVPGDDPAADPLVVDDAVHGMLGLGAPGLIRVERDRDDRPAAGPGRDPGIETPRAHALIVPPPCPPWAYITSPAPGPVAASSPWPPPSRSCSATSPRRTRTPSSPPRTSPCWAAAESTGRSTGPPDRGWRRPAGRSGRASRVTRWRRPPSAWTRPCVTSSIPSGRSGKAAATARTPSWPRATGAASRWRTPWAPGPSRSPPSPPGSTGSRPSGPRGSPSRPSGRRPRPSGTCGSWRSTSRPSTSSGGRCAPAAGASRAGPARAQPRRQRHRLGRIPGARP